MPETTHKRPTEASKGVLHKAFSSYVKRPKDFEFFEDGLGGFTVIYHDGTQAPGFSFGVFRGNPALRDEYFSTFK